MLHSRELCAEDALTVAPRLLGQLLVLGPVTPRNAPMWGPVEGRELVQQRRGDKRGPVLLTGPGKVGQALGLDAAWRLAAPHSPWVSKRRGLA